jgi:undecaprenyl diphosphate synthase
MSINNNENSTLPTTESTNPRHVAVIMDGNGRWAKKRHMPRIVGHRAGVAATRSIVEVCAQKHIDVLTLFAFSSENWRRPEQEVSLLMDLFMSSLKREVKKLHENGIRLRIIGDTSRFSDKLQQQIEVSENLTRDNQGLQLVIAVNYGGRWDITQATRRLAAAVAEGRMHWNDITEQSMHDCLALSDLPEPDLFIRTGGEQRVSNFILWQLAYTELYFTDTLWPDFDRQAFELALTSFAGRQRRFGQTGDQVEHAHHV